MSADMPLVATRCPFCNSGDIRATVQGTERLYERGGSFEYKVCASCGSLYLYDRSIDLNAYYPEDYYSYAGTRRPRLQAAAESFFSRQRARFVLRLVRAAGAPVDRDAWILDVGSGAGDLLRAFRSIGFGRVAGIDPYLRADVDTGGVPVERQTIEELANDPRYAGSCAIVMFHHSLEHVFDPAADLDAARRLLKPGGSIVVRLPVVNYAWERYGTCWVGFDAPRHVAIPTERGMHDVAARAGLRVARVKYDSTEIQFVVSEAYERGLTPLKAFPSSPPRTALRKFLTIPKMLRAAWLNAQKRGDQAAFVLRPEDGTC
ncbi:MAG: class I SAM-dependent methyltransferase [Candidatus Eremiobacteraeota bacterium]|nr:class I SAM-dependent methyltransferase [Candidatus Eremiobacteraeota bacterium]